MINFRSLTTLTICLLATISSYANDNKILVVTENTDINVALADQPGSGEATRFVKTLLDTADLDYNIRTVPWRRGYQMAKTRANTLIYPLARTKTREKDFHWVGKLIPVHYYLFRLKSRDDLKLNNLEQAKEHNIGVVNYHAHHEFLLREGMTRLQPVNNSDQNIKKLLLGRIDYFSMSDTGILPLCEHNNIDCEQLTPEIELEGLAPGLFIAFSKQTDVEKIERLHRAYRSLVDDGTHSENFARRRHMLKQFKNTYPEVEKRGGKKRR